MKVKERLAELYPTATAFQAGKDTYETWAKMGRALGISQGALYAHKIVLTMGKTPKNVQENQFCYLTAEDLEENMQAVLHDSSVNKVMLYKIVKPEIFYLNQIGYLGLEFIREMKGSTWAQVAKGGMPGAMQQRHEVTA